MAQVSVHHIFTSPIADGTNTEVVRPSDWNSAHSVAITALDGIAASNTTYTSGTVVLSGGANVTVGTNGQTITISAGGGAETQVAISGVGNSQTTYSSGTVNLSVNGGLLTIRSTTGQAFQFSVSQSVQAETQTFLGAVGNSQTTYTSGTVNLSVVAGNLTIRSTTGQAFQFSASQTVQAETQTFLGGFANSETTYTSGSVTLSALGAITIRSTTGQHFQLSVNSQTAQTGISGMANSQTTYTSGTVSLSELGAITIRSTTGNQYQFSVNSQTVQTQNLVAISASNNLFSSGTVTMSGFGDVTVNTAAGLIRISAPTQTAQTGISGIAGSNTTYTSGTVTITGVGGGITVSSNTGQRIDLSVAAPVAQTVQTQNVHNVTLSGNTAGAMAHVSSGTLTLAGGNNITLSQAGNAVTISAPNLGAGAMSAGVSNLGNTAGATGVTGTRLVLVGTNNVTLSQTTDANGGTVTISAAGGGAAPTLSFFRNQEPDTGATPINTTAFTASHRSIGVSPLVGHMDPFPGNMTVSSMYLLMSLSGSTATNSLAYTSMFRLALYTLNVGTLSLLNSVSMSFGTGAAATNASTLNHGVRWVSFHSSEWSAQPVLSAGVPYWFATHWSSAGALNQTGAIFGQNIAQSASLIVGTVGAASVANNTSRGWAPFYGVYSVTSAAFPASIGTNELNKQLALGVQVPMVIFNNITSNF